MLPVDPSQACEEGSFVSPREAPVVVKTTYSVDAAQLAQETNQMVASLMKRKQTSEGEHSTDRWKSMLSNLKQQQTAQPTSLSALHPPASPAPAPPSTPTLDSFPRPQSKAADNDPNLARDLANEIAEMKLILRETKVDVQSSSGTLSTAPLQQVRFDSVTIYSHDMILGDNPAVSQGAPVTLDWTHSRCQVVSVDEFEEHIRPTVAPDFDRQAYLESLYAKDELDQVMTDIWQIQTSRQFHALESKVLKRMWTDAALRDLALKETRLEEYRTIMGAGSKRTQRRRPVVEQAPKKRGLFRRRR